jgi:hypothetical protein
MVAVLLSISSGLFIKSADWKSGKISNAGSGCSRFFRRLFTLLAIEDAAKMLLAAFRSYHPWSAKERRLVPDMLPMAAGQIGHPVAKFILMIRDDRLVHT